MRFLIYFTLLAMIFTGCQVITDPQPEDCNQVSVMIEKIEQGSSADIQLHDSQTGNWYYINRGLEKRLIIKDLEKELLDVPAELWVVKNSRHVAQVSKGDAILYTEFE